MPRKTFYGNEARQILKRGVDALGDAVRTSLGPKGRNSVIWRGYGLPIVTKDGVQIAKEIDPTDPAERMGAELVRQAALKTNDAVGDGTTTSTVLAQEIVRLGIEALEADPTLDVHVLRQQAEARVEEICRALDAMAVPVASDREKLEQVAIISANNDKETGKTIADVMFDVGPQGVVTVDDGHEIGIKVERVEGMQFARGFVTPQMMTDYDRLVAELGDVSVIVTDYRVTTAKELVALVQPCLDNGQKNIFLIAEALEGDALTIAVANGPMFKKNFNVVATTPPGYGDRKKEMMQDICALTGTTLISLENGKKLENVTFADYGSATRITVEQDKTTIVGGKGSPEAIKSRLALIQAQMDKAESTFDKEKFKERQAKLQGGVAVIRVGAVTEAEAKEKKYLIEDAVNAVKAAMQEGIVAGGGMALVRCAGDKKSIVDEACAAPFEMIIRNAGADPTECARRAGIAFGYSQDNGFDVKSMLPVPSMLAAGIVDPVSVTKSALRNACSVAMSILTTETLIVEVPETK